ncbi:hypothetical protein CHARACLAT_022289 [Characodon lateralis]|uniref:Uncharacterized protein n=1 Tax=Characodon lateralis TaxID=208331 RepID=A0ABU7F541_9TELE|nr:hypothetical protein [Characodon lateralis]
MLAPYQRLVICEFQRVSHQSHTGLSTNPLLCCPTFHWLFQVMYRIGTFIFHDNIDINQQSNVLKLLDFYFKAPVCFVLAIGIVQKVEEFVTDLIDFSDFF